jgi:hypothetical protein
MSWWILCQWVLYSSSIIVVKSCIQTDWVLRRLVLDSPVLLRKQMPYCDVPEHAYSISAFWLLTKKRYPFSEHRCSERQQWCNVTMSTCTDVNVNLKFSSKFWSIRSELQILSEFTHSPTPIFETPTAPSPQIHAMLRLRREASQLRFISFQLDVCARDVDVDRSEKGERELVWEFRESSKEINFLLDQNGHVAQW